MRTVFHFSLQEWQARQREKTKELHRLRQKEDEEEERKVQEYREIGTRLKGFPEEEVKKARRLVSSFILAAEEVEEVCYSSCSFSYYLLLWIPFFSLLSSVAQEFSSVIINCFPVKSL